MSTQDSDAPKRRSSAANRRRNRRLSANRSEGVTATATAVKPREVTQASQSDLVKEAADREEKAKHLRRQEERREAKARKDETSRGRKFINTERFGGARRFYESTASEIRKVNWPDRETTRNLTIVVIALSVVMGILLGSIDYVLFQLFEALP